MTNTTVIDPSVRTLHTARRGVVLGGTALVLSLVASFWALMLWLISVSVHGVDANLFAEIVFVVVALVGMTTLAVSAVFGVLAIIRNSQVGVICASVAILLLVGAAILGLTAAIDLTSR